MGLPPTPEELELVDEAYDAYIDSLPLWERNKALKNDGPKEELWSRKRRTWWWIGFLTSSAWALVTFPFVIMFMIIPPVGLLLWFIGFAPVGFSICCRVHEQVRAGYNKVTE